MLARGERIENLVDKTDNLRTQADRFHRWLLFWPVSLSAHSALAALWLLLLFAGSYFGGSLASSNHDGCAERAFAGVAAPDKTGPCSFCHGLF